MAEVKILIQGWTNADDLKKGEEENDACTTSLVKDGDIIAVVDPGVLDDQQILIDVLAKEGLKIADITHIFLTHSHIDHYRNVGMFPASTKVVEFWGEWTGGHPKQWQEEYSENISIIKTPGHSPDGLTFLVKTQEGTIAVAGDLWWSKSGLDIDPYAFDMQKLRESRERVLEIADYIIPGHGDIFGVKK